MENSNYLYFGNDPTIIDGFAKFAVLPNVLDQLRECGYDPEMVFRKISSLKSILVSSYEGQDGDIRYKLHTPYGTFPFKESTDADSFLLLGFNESTFIDINTALIYGIRFAATLGTVLMVRMVAYEWFSAYVQGGEFDANEYNSVDGFNAIDVIRATCYRERTGLDSVKEKEEVEMAKDTLKLLELAENYAILSNDLEKKKAEEIGQISYNGYEAVDYPRNDRIAYDFCIEKQEKQVFAAGTNVDILDSSGDVGFTAELVDVKQKGKKEYLTMLFTKEVDLSTMPQMGWIRLSISTVNMDVQLGAIKKIRDGIAKAKYFNDIFGEKKPQGFYNNNLKELEKKLSLKKYPPNQSQVSAIKKGINSKDVYLVMGPPGTGKTTVILEWVKYFVKEKHFRVLVSSQNNKAVDNVLERLAEEKDIDTIRIGSEAKVQEAVIPYIFENKLITLRKKIYDSTNTAVEQTKKAIEDWGPYIKLLKSHVEKIDKLEEERLKSREYVQKYINPFKKRLIELSAENSYILDQIKKKIIDNEKALLEKEKYYSSNKFLQLINRRKIKIINETLEKHYEKMEELVKKQNAIALSYNDNYSKLKNNYAYFDSKVLVDFYNSYLVLVDSVNSISGKAPDNYSAVNLYSVRELDETELMNRKTVLAYCEYIKNEHKRAMSLRKIIKEWKAEIEESQNYALHQIVLDSVDLVGATCIGVSSQKRFQELDFDVTIIDEAGQIQLHNSFVPMSVSNKVIMLGDHMQIPPNADQDLVLLCEENDVNPELLSKSLFEKMYYELPESNKTLLDTQYRMPAEIADVISEWFYDGEYKSPDFLRGTKATVPSISNQNFVLVNTPPKENCVYETKDPEGGYNNNTEALAIKKIVSYILRTTDINEKQIGIISAYKSQVKLIKNQLKEVVISGAIDEMVASLDSFQGQERDVIIYSFTRSSKKTENQSRIGFLNELRRLNVAMSRCKKLLIMIGDYDYLSKCRKDEAKQVIYAKDGKRIVNGSEAVFSQFICTMCKSAKDGKGEMIDVSELLKRIEG